MQVFKVYFKIIKKNIPLLSIYVIIFLAISIIMTNSNPVGDFSNFTETKYRVAFINNDVDSEFISDLKEYIGEHSVIMNIANDKEALQDAFFFKEVEYIVEIPKGFTESFLNGDNVILDEKRVQDSAAGVYMNMLVNNYLNTARLYLGNISDISQYELVEKIKADLSKETIVELNSYENESSEFSRMSYFFNFATYSTLLILMLGITTFMIVFERTDLKRRNLCSPLSESKISIQSLLANLVFVIVVWALNLVSAFVLYGSTMLTLNGLLFAVNLLIMSLVVLSISFMVGTQIKGRTAQAAVANTLGLGLCFLTGVFVPQFLLGDAVNSVGRFLPTYWYVKANDIIGGLTSFSGNAFTDIIYCYLIQLGFAIAFVSISLVLIKQKRAALA